MGYVRAMANKWKETCPRFAGPTGPTGRFGPHGYVPNHQPDWNDDGFSCIKLIAS